MVTFSRHALVAPLVKWLEHNSHESSPNGPFLKFILLCTERGVTPWHSIYIHMQAIKKLMQMMTEEFFMNFPTWIGYRGWEKRSPGSDEHMFFRRWLIVGTSVVTLHQASTTKPMYASACLLNGRSDHKKVEKILISLSKYMFVILGMSIAITRVQAHITIFPWSKLVLWLSHFDLGVMID